MISTQRIQEVVGDLSSIGEDISVPRNVRMKIMKAVSILGSNLEQDINLRIDQSLQELGDIAEDPNLPQYTRMQIWSVVSLLESK